MTWIRVKRTMKSSDEPIIKLSEQRFHYNVVFHRLAELGKYESVVYHADPDDRKIAFEFFKDNTQEDGYKLEKKANKGTRSNAIELLNQFAWAAKVEKLKEPELKKFIARKDGRFWIIQLSPAFENRSDRHDSANIDTKAQGIYRYLDEGVIVYIGKGNIRKRLGESDRTTWKFDTIEYSEIQSEQSQFDWEFFWMERFKERNNGRLPYYNAISGTKPK